MDEIDRMIAEGCPHCHDHDSHADVVSEPNETQEKHHDSQRID
jgi:hypothetical protein